MRRVVESAQSAPGGELQLTLAHGSGLHEPPLQPKGQFVSLGVEEQTPPEQTAAEYVRRVVALAHMGAGNVHGKFCEV